MPTRSVTSAPPVIPVASTILPWTVEIIIAAKSLSLVVSAASTPKTHLATTLVEAFYGQNWPCVTTLSASSATRLLTGSWSAHTWDVMTLLSRRSKTNTRTTITTAVSMPLRHGVTL
ncbi:uncharacterized protein LOC144909369 [Branchiostoma floridae x Branchiostoma belcheri]